MWGRGEDIWVGGGGRIVWCGGGGRIFGGPNDFHIFLRTCQCSPHCVVRCNYYQY